MNDNGDLDYKHPPIFLQHVQDRDLWEFKLPYSKAIIRGATLRQQTIETIDQYMKMSNEELNTVAAIGEALLMSDETLIKGIVKECSRKIAISGAFEQIHELPLINAPGALFSEMGDFVGSSKDVEGVIMYYDTPTHRVFGLRSNKVHGIDVSIIAVEYGGGGHKNAAGFKVTRDHPLATI
jgi:oligoribonuclease NrnB/cAMP/cGMP phosphodiesterase (DHH superfamily)